MPAIGSRGPLAPRELARAKAAPAPKRGPVFSGPLDSHPAFQQSGLTSPAHTATPPPKGTYSTAHTGQSRVPAPPKYVPAVSGGKRIGKLPSAPGFYYLGSHLFKTSDTAPPQEVTKGQVPRQTLKGLERAEHYELNHLPISAGVVTPSIPGLSALAKASAAGRAIGAITGTASNKSLLGRVFNEGLGMVRGALPATVELGEHPLRVASQTASHIGHVILHPWSSLKNEPVGTALILSGAKSAVGRGAGFAGRSGLAGEKAAQVASRERAPLVIYGNATGASGDQLAAGMHDVAIPRRHSPDVINKGLQVAVDKYRQNALGRHPNMATGEQANRYLYGGGLLGQHVMKRFQGLVKPGEVDKEAAKGELLRRSYASAAASYLHQIKPKVGADAVPLAVEGVIKRPETVVPDLQKELDRLKAVKTDSNKEKRLNKGNQKQIETLLGDKKFIANPRAAFEAARQYSDWSRPIEEQLVRLGHLEPDQLHARNIPYALAHMDAKLNLAPGPHPKVGELAAAAKELKNARQGVRDSLEARKAAEIAHPSAGVTTRVATARRSLRGAELAKAEAEGRGDRAGITGHQNTVREARAEYKYAKQEHVENLARKADQAYERHLNADKRVQDISRELHDLKQAGKIKANGDQYPRLEVNGQHLSHEQIEARMAKELGDRRVGFLTHKIEQTYGKNLQSFAGKRPGTETRMRTGTSFEKGIYKRDYGALRLQAYRNANLLAGHESYDQMLRRFGLGRFHTKEEAERAADRYTQTPEGKRLESLGNLTVHQIGPDRIVSRGNVQTRAFGPIINDFLGPTDRAIKESIDAPKYTLLHDRVAQRINEHDALNKTNSLSKALQWYTNKWRSAALYTSPRWLLGNPQEHAIRLAFASVNPAAIFGAGKAVRLGKDILGEWHSIAADTSRSEAERYVAQTHIAAYEAGTHYGSLATNEVRREAKDALEQGRSRDLAEAFDEATGPRQMLAGWGKWKGAIGQAMSAVERNTKAAGLGKAALNETSKFSKDWQSLITRQDHAVKAFAENKLAPNEAAKLGDDIMSMLGNWNTLTPTVRRAVQTVSPFGLWWLNSMKFVFRTLPADHPFKTAALAAMVSATGQGAKEDPLPEYLKGGIAFTLPVVGKVTLTPGYYTPGGVAIEPPKTAADMFLPQVTDAALLARGVNPATDKEIRGASWEQLAAQALYSGIIGAVPGLRQAGQLVEQGGKHEYGSANPFAVKPGTQRGLPTTLTKIFSPLRMTLAPKEGSTGKGRSSGGGRSGGGGGRSSGGGRSGSGGGRS